VAASFRHGIWMISFGNVRGAMLLRPDVCAWRPARSSD
jgi:hypothetical protein